MISHISEELGLIINLRNTAIFHKAFCKDKDCGVALMQLKQAASYISIALKLKGNLEQYNEAVRIIKEMPIV